MFENCKSLIYLNLNLFNLKNSTNITDVFKGISPYVKFCINDIDTQNFLLTDGKISECSNKCFQTNIKIDIINKTCVESCLINGYEYEYNNICSKECPKGTLINDHKCEDNKCIENKQESLECFNETPIGYYLDIKDNIFKKCFENCKICFSEGNETINNCYKCKHNFTFLNESKYENNCYEKCNYFYYFDKFNKYNCSKTCPEEYKLIINKNKCIDSCKNDDIYRYEYNNSCYQDCPNGTITDKNNYTCYDFMNIETTNINEINTTVILSTNIFKDKIDEKIENFRGIVSNFNISVNKEDIITKEDNVQYQMTTSDNQKNNSNKNISSIDLGDCEIRLKNIYGINQSLPLIIFKIDYFSPDSLIPIIGYEIYHPLNKSKLNLSYCEDILIKLNIPVSIDETKLFKYDPNSEFYTDNCFSYTTDNGTDIILDDRKDEFTNNNLSLCQNNCN